MFERVEIIRGPASALYGTSAFFAVVNVITRTGASLNGGSIFMEGGIARHAQGRARPLGGASRTASISPLSGTLHESDGDERLYFPSFDAPATNGGVAEDLDGERIGQFYGRVGDEGRDDYWRVRSQEQGRADGLFRHGVQRTDRARMDDRSTDAHRCAIRSRLRRHPFRGTRRRSIGYAYAGVYPLPGDDDASPVVINDDGALGTRWGADAAADAQPAGKANRVDRRRVHAQRSPESGTTYDSPSLAGFDHRTIHRAGSASTARTRSRFARGCWPTLACDTTTTRRRSRVTARGGNRHALPNAIVQGPVRAMRSVPRTSTSCCITRWASRTRTCVPSRSTRTSSCGSATPANGCGPRHRPTGTTRSGLISLEEISTSFDGLTFMNTDHARARGLELEAEMRLKNGTQAVSAIRSSTPPTKRPALD